MAIAKKAVTVLIADDHDLFCDMLKYFLESITPDIRVEAVGSLAEAAALIDPLTSGPADRDHHLVHECRVEIDVHSTVAGWDDHTLYTQRVRNYSKKPIDLEVRRIIHQLRTIFGTCCRVDRRKKHPATCHRLLRLGCEGLT